MNNGTDQTKPTMKQLAELLGYMQGQTAEVVTEFFSGTTFDEVQSMLRNKKNIGKTFRMLLAPLFANADPYATQRVYWEKFFREHYGVAVDLSDVRIPTKPTEGKWRLIMIAKGLTMNHAALCYKAIIRAHNHDGNLWQYHTDLDASVTENARTSAESYAIWVRDEAEPDKQYLGKSTLEADPDKTIGVTLLERLVHGAIHFLETKKHLDEQVVTLCTGSYSSGGGVPYVGWDSDAREVCVSRCAVRNSDPVDGLRLAVIL